MEQAQICAEGYEEIHLSLLCGSFLPLLIISFSFLNWKSNNWIRVFQIQYKMERSVDSFSYFVSWRIFLIPEWSLDGWGYLEWKVLIIWNGPNFGLLCEPLEMRLTRWLLFLTKPDFKEQLSFLDKTLSFFCICSLKL